MPNEIDIARNRQLLVAAQEKGRFSTLGAFFRLSGPGWLQSAITLGGGSLGSSVPWRSWRNVDAVAESYRDNCWRDHAFVDQLRRSFVR